VGLAEYTNANFASRNTLFTEAFDPAHKWWSPYPRRTSTNLAELGLPETLVAEDGQLDRTIYVRKERDGEAVAHFAKPTYAATVIADVMGLPVNALALGFQLDDRVFEDYAQFLLPRAVGYSTALLDYFFRGRLEAELGLDPVDISQYRLIARNASGEPLVDGTVTLYADDPTSGVRRAVPALNKRPVSGIEPGQPLFEPLAFQPPPGAERFMLVYQGTLGQEAKDDSRNLPGAVIGKSLGGLRVEALLGGAIQTADQSYPLPLPAAWGSLRWGDRDNTLVARMGDYRFLAYEIARPVGSAAMPPLVPQPDGSLAVDLKLLREASFPLGLALGTTLEMTETIHYKAYVPSFTDTNNILVECVDPTDESTCSYTLRDTTTTGEMRLVVEETRPVTHTFPLTLDANNYRANAPGGAYYWTIEDHALTADGQILAVVAVRPRYVDYWWLEPDAYTFPVANTVYNPAMRISNKLPWIQEEWQVWAIVNVGTGQVVASTAPPTIHIAADAYHTYLSPPRPLFGTSGSLYPSIEALFSVRNHYIGGPARPDESWEVGWVPGLESCPEGTTSTGLSLGTVDVEDVGGPLSFVYTALGSFRGEIAGLQFPPSPPSPPRTYSSRVFFRCGAPDLSVKAVSLDVTSTITDGQTLLPTDLTARRAGPGVGAGQLVLLAEQAQPYRDCPVSEEPVITPGCGGYLARVGNWTVNQGNAVVRQEFPLSGGVSLVRASAGAALLTLTLAEGGQRTTLVPLQGAAPAIVFPGVSLDDFFPIEPGLLYSANAAQFYRRQAPLQPTPLPRPLPAGYADPYTPAIPYHTLVLK
jgi:hypothetical protein